MAYSDIVNINTLVKRCTNYVLCTRKMQSIEGGEARTSIRTYVNRQT